MTSSLLSNVDALGYYLVGNNAHTSKTIAYSESLRTGNKLHYIYNDEIFRKYDWTTEPEPAVAINEFYRSRAQQIRDNYDYVILQYSGGPDSQNVLDTFLNYDIPLDEIVNFNSYDSTQIVQGTTHNADYLYNVKPVIESIIKEKGNAIKITIVDEIDMTKKVWKEYADKDYFELLFSSGTFPSVWMMRGIWIKHIPHIWNKILEGKRVCIVLGTDKTMLRLNTTINKYYTDFNDILSTDTATLALADKDLNGHSITELFYHTPSMPDLTIKQAHLLKKYIDKSTDVNQFEPLALHNGKETRHAINCRSKMFPMMNLKYEQYHKIVYPWWKTNIVTPKPAYFGNRAVDCWWVDKLAESDKRVWTNGIEKYLKSFGSGITRMGNNITTIPIVFTKPYYLEQIKYTV